MPTVSNHDVLGTLSWGAGGNARHFNRDPFGEPLGGRGDARDGINSLLFGEGQQHVGGGGAGACAPGAPVQAEHAYALAQQQVAPAAPRAGSFVSQNGYYGYQQPHGAQALADADCSMDTGENNPPAHAFGAFGVHPSLGGGFAGPWQPDNAEPINRVQRKRNLSARGPAPAGPAVLAAPAAHPHLDASLGERACKRLRPSPFGEQEQPTLDLGTTEAMMVHGYGMPRSTPSIAEQSHSPVQMYDLPTQQLPGTSSQLVDMTPRPRYISGAGIRTEILYGGKMKQCLLEESELAALESLLKHTHGCDYYNYDGCEL